MLQSFYEYLRDNGMKNYIYHIKIKDEDV
jgi:hypothetical protein